MTTTSNSEGISLDLARTYFRLFVNRRAHTVQAMSPTPGMDRCGFFKPRGEVPLTLAKVQAHLAGQVTVGLYAISPATQRSKWLCLDADYSGAVADLTRVQDCLRSDGVHAALEESRRGGHLWFFAEEPLLAVELRTYIFDVLARVGVALKNEAAHLEGVEIFPGQDWLLPGSFGNAMRGPLGVHRSAGRRFWFVGVEHNLAAQIAFLASLPKLIATDLAKLIAGKARATTTIRTTQKTLKSRWSILDFISTPLRRSGREYRTACPSCRLQGGDREGDDLSISIERPSTFRCWHGCTKDEIRRAAGCSRNTVEENLRRMGVIQ